jgi:hypothetical protein
MRKTSIFAATEIRRAPIAELRSMGASLPPFRGLSSPLPRAHRQSRRPSPIPYSHAGTLRLWGHASATRGSNRRREATFSQGIRAARMGGRHLNRSTGFDHGPHAVPPAGMDFSVQSVLDCRLAATSG